MLLIQAPHTPLTHLGIWFELPFPFGNSSLVSLIQSCTFVLNVPAFRHPFSLKIPSEPRKARQKLHFSITCTTYINICTSNKWLLKAVSFPHFFNRTLNIIILINILEKAQIFIGSKHQVFTPGLESTPTDKPVSLFIKT